MLDPNCRSHHRTESSLQSTMATNLQFIPGRKQGSENPILNGFSVFDKRSNDTSYWKCGNTWIGTSTTNPNFAPQQHEAAQMRILAHPTSQKVGITESIQCCPARRQLSSLIALKLTDVKKTKRDGRELPEPRAPKWIMIFREL